MILPSGTIARDFTLSDLHLSGSPDEITVRFACRNLFLPPIKKSLLAGLPVLAEFNLQLIDLKNQPVLERRFTVKIHYDVWEELFSLQLPEDRTATWKDFSRLDQWFRAVQFSLPLNRTDLSEKAFYRVRISARVVVLTRQQKEELKWWMQNSETTEEETAAQERSTGFRLNLNRIIQLFLEKEKKPVESVSQLVSPPFKMDELLSQ